MAFDPVLNNKNLDDQQYDVDPTRWYKAYPYGFEFWSFDSKKNSKASETFWLPIAPSNINVTTHYATNIVTTLYGIVEEHSEVRYYDITIAGNTGIAPKYTVPHSTVTGGITGPTGVSGVAKSIRGKPDPNPKNPGTPSTGRSSFDSSNTSALNGFLPEVSNTISTAVNLVKSIASGGQVVNDTGITPEQSGYHAFHNFYKFLLRYKMDASRNGPEGSAATLQVLDNLQTQHSVGSSRNPDRVKHPLNFLNYKDNIKYNCIPIAFTLVRDASNPMLYNYTIKLRAFNLRNVNAKDVYDSDLLAELGLGDLSGSLFSSMTNVVGKASVLISGLGGSF